jgi:hypothetical protein
VSLIQDYNMKQIDLLGRDGEPFSFTGAKLGHGSSARNHHNHNTSIDEFAPQRYRCSGCRWFEVDIYLTAEDRYVVHTTGVSVVPGESRLSRISVTESPFEVIELLTVRKKNEEPFITTQSARALAQAAEVDDGIREAYINRAVV